MLLVIVVGCATPKGRLASDSGVEDPLLCLAVSGPQDRPKQMAQFRRSFESLADRRTTLDCGSESCMIDAAKAQQCDAAIIAIVSYFGSPSGEPLVHDAARGDGKSCRILGTKWTIRGEARGYYWTRGDPSTIRSSGRQGSPNSERAYSSFSMVDKKGRFLRVGCDGVKRLDDEVAKRRLTENAGSQLATKVKHKLVY